MAIIKNNRITKTVLLILLFVKLFEIKIPYPWGWFDFPLLILLVFISWSNKRVKTIYEKYTLLFLDLLLISSLYTSFFKGQNFFGVLGHSYKYCGLIFLFYLFKEKFTWKEVENILIYFSIVCSICYIIQWLIYPTIIFGGAASEAWSDELYRARIPGSIGCYCLLFYGINIFLLRKKTLYLIYVLLGGIPILIQGFRTFITLTVIAIFFSIPLTTKKIGKSLFYYVFFAIMAFTILQSTVVKNKIDEMQMRQEGGATFENKDYVRWLELDYYWNEQCPNVADKIFGGGVSDGKSNYAKQMSKAYMKRIFWDDLGLVGLGLIIGYPAVLVLITIYLFCIYKCKEPRLQYIRFSLIVVLLGSLFTTAELFRLGNILLLSLFLYIEYMYHNTKRINKQNYS